MERFGFPSIYIESILLSCLFSAQYNGALSHASKRSKRTGSACVGGRTACWGSAGGLFLGRKVPSEMEIPAYNLNK